MSACKTFSHQQVHQLLDEVRRGRACTPSASPRSPMARWG